MRIRNFPTDVTNPAETGSPTGVAGGDCCDGWTRPNPGGYQYTLGTIGNPPTTPWNNQGGFVQAAARHTGGANYALADGHVKFLRGSSISPGYSNTSGPTFPQGSNGNNACGTGDLSSGGFQVTFSEN